MKVARRSTSHAIEELLGKRGKGSFVSVAELVDGVRRMVPACELTDRELGDAAAMHAINHRCNVSFDLSNRPFRDGLFAVQPLGWTVGD